MPVPLLLVGLPPLLALIIYAGLRRWPAAAGITGFLSAVLIGLLLARASLQPDVATPTLFQGDELTFLGRSLLLTEGLRRVLLIIYAGSALLFLSSAHWSQGPDFVPAGLAALAPLAFALMVTPLAFGVVALLLAAALLAALVQGQRPGSTLASLRYLILTALAVPALLIAGWMLESQQFALLATIWRLLLLGAALLLAGFPFHIWVRPLLKEARPLTAVFVLGPVQLAVLTFIWRWVQQNGEFLPSTGFGAALGWSGAATAFIAAFLASQAGGPRRLLGALVLADAAATLICLAQGVAGIEQAWSLLIVRFLGLGLAAVGLEWAATAQPDNGEDDAAQLADNPFAAVLFFTGALSLIGLPFTPGFAARWSAVQLAGATSIWWALALLLAIALGTVGLMRVLHPLATPLTRRIQQVIENREAARLPLALLGATLVLTAALAVYPWPLLNLAARLNELF